MTSALFFLVLLCSAPVSYGNLTELSKTVTYNAAVHAAQEEVVLLADALMDIDQGVSRYAFKPGERSRQHYFEGAERFEKHLGSLKRFAGDNQLTDMSRNLASLSTKYTRFQGEVAIPTLNRRTARLSATLARGDDLIDAAQQDLIMIHFGLASASDAQGAAIEKRIWASIVGGTMLLLLLSAIGLWVDHQRRREHMVNKIVLEERAAALERSNIALQDFAHVASHDLQEPLRMVSSYTQLLARRYKGKLDSDADEFIGYAVDGAKRMQVLIENILSYSRISSAEHDTVPVDSRLACDDALANLEGLISDTGAHVTSTPLPRVLGDQGQLARLFQNLIGNALKYRSEKTPEIEISASRDHALWNFSVSDNGIGIAEEYRERVFRMFQRLHAKTEYSGTGIGLAVCRRIVERHGGTIWIDAPPGGGTTFHFTLQAA